MEQPGPELDPIWDVGAASGGLTCYAIAPAPRAHINNTVGRTKESRRKELEGLQWENKQKSDIKNLRELHGNEKTRNEYKFKIH